MMSYLHVSLVVLLSSVVWGVADVTVVDRPDTSQTNRFYIGNLPPLEPSPLLKLPMRRIEPAGWLRKQLELQADGFHGHLEEISRFLVKKDNAWLNPEGKGKNGWEEVPYWLKGFGDCAYLLGREDQIKEARVWIEGALASQRADGFFGPRPGTKSTVGSTEGDYDLWGNMIMLFCLQSYYDYSGDQRVLDLMRRYFQWELTVPDDKFLPPYWQHQRGADNLYSVYWLYNRTGEQWLLKLADKVYRHTADWTDGIPNWHNVNMAQAFGGPATYWMQSRNLQHLQAAERNWETIRKAYGQVPGGMFGGDENCRPGYTDPRQAIETCGMVEMMLSEETLLQITGNLIWADRCEDVTFNSLPAALTPDLKALRYLTAPNMAVSDASNHAPGVQNGGPMLLMDPHSHRCCQHNFGHGWPYYAEHLWMATPDNGLAAALFSECNVKARVGDGTEVTVAEKTHYPFDEQVEFTVDAPRRVTFPLYLRVPGWCDSAAIAINGERVPLVTAPLRYIRIERAWAPGDRVQLSLPMKVSLRTWTANHNSVSVDRGPLTYSLKIGEKYVRAGGTDQWPAWEIYPTTPWNYGLVLPPDNPASAFEVVRRPWPASNMPFTHEGTPIELTATGKRIPEWQLDRFGLVATLHDSPVKSEEPAEKITLIPMGAARLRISSFPVIGEGSQAHEWPQPPQPLPYKATASHCYGNDTVEALEDQVVPKNSHDEGLQRFTWWDHRGTREWVQYNFAQPKKLSAVQVYWFDDTGTGQCRVPESWRVLYQDNGEWKEVPNPTEATVAKDRFNKVSFDPVHTSALRLEVQLQPMFSGGVPGVAGGIGSAEHLFRALLRSLTVAALLPETAHVDRAARVSKRHCILSLPRSFALPHGRGSVARFLCAPTVAALSAHGRGSVTRLLCASSRSRLCCPRLRTLTEPRA